MKQTNNSQLKPTNIVFFDGHCGLCLKSIQFLIQIDHDKRLYFSSLQGEYFEKNIKQNTQQRIDSLVFYCDNNLYYKSSAFIKIFKYLGGIYQFFGFFMAFIPLKLRDLVYDFIAKSRYKIFGRYETCYIPNSEIKERFIS